MLLKEFPLSPLTPVSHVLVNGMAVVVDSMTASQLTETYLLVREAARHGQGFGAEEYRDEKEFLDDVAEGYHYAVMDKSSGVMVAAFILAVSKYSRGCMVADPFIVVKKDMRGCRLGTFCLDMCVSFAKQLGFQGIYCDTFSNNTGMIKIIEGCPGFKQVGALPMGGVMADGRVVGTQIYYKDLRNNGEG